MLRYGFLAGLVMAAVIACSSATCGAKACVGSHKATARSKAYVKKKAMKPSGAKSGAGPGREMAMEKREVTMVPGLTVAPVSVIKQRGHVNNLCEENEMMLTLVRQSGGMETFGDYKVAYVMGQPEGWYELQGDQLVWRDPAPGETVHLETVVLDAFTGKWMPVPGVTLDIVGQDGNTVETHELIMLWHPMADHYGYNYSIPAGTYNLHIHAPVPPMGRHSKELGQRFSAPIDATFTGVVINPDQLPKL